MEDGRDGGWKIGEMGDEKNGRMRGMKDGGISEGKVTQLFYLHHHVQIQQLKKLTSNSETYRFIFLKQISHLEL